jgi:hypothetical protein
MTDRDKLIEAIARALCIQNADDPEREGPWQEWWRESTYALDAQAALNTLETAGLLPKWMPIDSAPTDGRVFFVNASDVTSTMTLATFRKGELVSLWDEKTFRPNVTKPRFWAPLPSPPKFRWSIR